MNSRLFLLPLLLLVLASNAWADYRVERVLAAGDHDSLWVGVIRTDDDPKNPRPLMSSVRTRVDPIAGRWVEAAVLQADVTDLAPIGTQCAVLLANGDWKILGPHGGPDGTALPDGMIPRTFGSDGANLLAAADRSRRGSATQHASTGPSDETPAGGVYRWDWQTWKRLADLPPGVDAQNVSLAGSEGTIYLANVEKETTIIRRLEGTTWREAGRVSFSGAVRGKLIAGGPQVRLALCDKEGVWRVLTLDGASALGQPLPAKPVSDVAIVGPTLRLIYPAKDGLEQISIDQYGRGQQFGPSAVAEVAPPGQNTAQSWTTLAILALLTLSMLMTLKQRPVLPPEVLEQTQLRLAPVPRRIAAGVIDIAPLLLMMAYIGRHAEQQGIDMQSFGTALVGPFYLAAFVYVLHVTIGEIIWGRSIGKWLFGLRIASLDGTKVPAGRVILRNFMRLVDLSIIWIPLLLIVITPMRQRVGDLTARTVVIWDRPEDEPPAAEPPTPAE